VPPFEPGYRRERVDYIANRAEFHYDDSHFAANRKHVNYNIMSPTTRHPALSGFLLDLELLANGFAVASKGYSICKN